MKQGTYYLIVIVVTIIAVYNVLRLFGLFEFSKKNSKVISVIEADRKKGKQRRFEVRKMAFFEQITRMFEAMIMNGTVRENHTYYIQRLDIRNDVLNRPYTPEELRGKHFIPVLLGFVIIPIAVFVPPLFILTLGGLAYWFSYQIFYKQKIQDEDRIIDDYFIDLYLLMYSQLKRGSRARLSQVVDSYNTSTASQQDKRVKEVMLKLSGYMLNLLSLYEDHVAIPKLKEIYRSATIINFCNVAGQALNGIDNSDNLLTFKMSLTERKIKMMKKRSDKMIARGEKSIYLIYIILFIFIGVGWVSKLPLDMFKSMF